MENLYHVFAIRADNQEVLRDTCINFAWHDEERYVRLFDPDQFKSSKMLYFDAFSKILVKQGDIIIWKWDGTVAGYI